MGASGIPEVPQKLGEFLMGPDKSDNKNLILKKYFSSLNKQKSLVLLGGKKSELITSMQIF